MWPTELKKGPILTARGMVMSERTASTRSTYRRSTAEPDSSASAAMKYTFSSSASAPASCSRRACFVHPPIEIPLRLAMTGISSSAFVAST